MFYCLIRTGTICICLFPSVMWYNGCISPFHCGSIAIRSSVFKAWGRLQGYIYIIIVQELCESRGGRPGLSVLMSLLVSVDVKNY